MNVIRDYDFHPPDDVRRFEMPRSGVLQFDDDVFVAEVRYADVVLRHYAFADRWFKVNCTTDLDGGFVETGGGDDASPFAFNCDIATPMIRDGDAVYAVDLWLDMLVCADGRTHGCFDHHEFEAALSMGLLSAHEGAGAMAGRAELVELVESDRLVAFLAEICPFGATSPPAAPEMHRVGLGAVPILQPGVRPTWSVDR
jgi:hypothetical protein